ncbi:MAG: SpoIIE family protein phosphatase [Bacteroidetes bacterium SB0662_bin_6]|nr:SpoIIE family protein phosphatase [Bacteroidetes bacterium SB0668_bin_1]MYE04010.1 SpoIIE family protein phosphatase [Bacteroidetes bacterium SB0662_bin_6]
MSKNPYKILVVDDEPDLQPLMLQRMRRSIRSGKYTFVFAGNGIEALERLREQEDIDMVVSDINMPQMDGLTLLDQIAQLDPNIRSVIISAYGDMKNIRTAMNRGAFDFITKPVDFDDLRITIDRTLEHMARWREALASRDKLVSLQNELDIARKMQRAILPTEFPNKPDYRIFGDMEPARNVGGDFFDVIPLGRGRVGLAIADVSDKGVPAALFMMSSRTLLKGAAIGSTAPSDALREVNNMLCEKNDSMMFVTLLYGIYDPESGEFTYANAGHNSPVVLHSDKSCSMLPLTGGVAIGVMPELEYEQNTITLAPGETLTLYTDGVTEAMNEDKEELGEERLFDMLKGASSGEPEAITRAIFDGIKAFVGDAPQSDDITCLAIHRPEN